MNLDNLTIVQGKARDWSIYQTAVFDHCTNLPTSGSALVNAVAGSGKTTTIVQAMNHIPMHLSAIFLAFNKSIADELRTRVPPGFEAATLNSVGHRVLMKHGRFKLNRAKTANLLQRSWEGRALEPARTAARALINLAKSAGYIESEMDSQIWLSLADTFDIDLPRNEEMLVVRMCEKVLREGSDPGIEEIDFSDQLYLPIRWGLPFPKYDVVIGDEVQDFSSLNHQMIKAMLHETGCFIGVGDPRQAIYAFRGADSNSMTNLAEAFNAKELPLSITYRNPKSVVAFAQQLVPHIQCPDNAPEGRVEVEGILPELSDLTPNDLLICRNNAPILQLALRLLAERRPMRVLGDFGEQLTFFIKAFKTDDIRVFENRLKTWYNTERDKYAKEERWKKLAQIEDKFKSVSSLIPGHSDVRSMLFTLSKLFEPGNGPTLSSIHRSKGLEAERVYLIDPSLIPSKYAKTDAARQQEMNLKYVAITRAKSELHFCETAPAAEGDE